RSWPAGKRALFRRKLAERAGPLPGRAPGRTACRRGGGGGDGRRARFPYRATPGAAPAIALDRAPLVEPGCLARHWAARRTLAPARPGERRSLRYRSPSRDPRGTTAARVARGGLSLAGAVLFRAGAANSQRPVRVLESGLALVAGSESGES